MDTDGRVSRSLSLAFEVFTVVVATCGASVLVMLRWAPNEFAAWAFTDGHLLRLAAREAVVGGVLVAWLRGRGWRPLRISGRPVPSDLWHAVGITVSTYLVGWIVWIVFAASQPSMAARVASWDRFTGEPPSVVPIVLVCLVNPVYEEFLWLGYLVGRLEAGLGVANAAAISVALRVLVHLYQGPWAWLQILPCGVLFTVYFVRTRRLWALVGAHPLLDAIALTLRVIV